MTTLTTIGHGLFAGFEPGGNLVIECLWPDQAYADKGCRVVVQRADVPDLLRAIMAPADPSVPAGLESPAAIAMRREAENAPPTRAGALMATFLADAPAAATIANGGADAFADKAEALWRDTLMERLRHGACAIQATKDAALAVNEWRRAFGEDRTP